jgi:hypothetical protein
MVQNLSVFHKQQKICLSNLSFPILDLKWHFNTKMDQEYLIIIYSSNKIIMWEPVSAVKLFVKSLNDQITQFTVDPHIFGRIAILGSNLIQFINFDFSSNAIVEKSISKFYLMNQDTANPNSQGGLEVTRPGIVLFSNYWNNLLLESGDQKQK